MTRTVSDLEREVCERVIAAQSEPLTAVQLSDLWAKCVSKLRIIAKESGYDEKFVEDHPVNHLLAWRASEVSSRGIWLTTYDSNLKILELIADYKMAQQPVAEEPDKVVMKVVDEGFSRALTESVMNTIAPAPTNTTSHQIEKMKIEFSEKMKNFETDVENLRKQAKVIVSKSEPKEAEPIDVAAKLGYGMKK